ncbi:MAG: hypothetical protein JNM90_08830 [Burkholderiales bacterium]|nr:hypothetical protein [Burkholderiales bacterium]
MIQPDGAITFHLPDPAYQRRLRVPVALMLLLALVPSWGMLVEAGWLTPPSPVWYANGESPGDGLGFAIGMSILSFMMPLCFWLLFRARAADSLASAPEGLRPMRGGRPGDLVSWSALASARVRRRLGRLQFRDATGRPLASIHPGLREGPALLARALDVATAGRLPAEFRSVGPVAFLALVLLGLIGCTGDIAYDLFDTLTWLDFWKARLADEPAATTKTALKAARAIDHLNALALVGAFGIALLVSTILVLLLAVHAMPLRVRIAADELQCTWWFGRRSYPMQDIVDVRLGRPFALLYPVLHLRSGKRVTIFHSGPLLGAGALPGVEVFLAIDHARKAWSARTEGRTESGAATEDQPSPFRQRPRPADAMPGRDQGVT